MFRLLHSLRSATYRKWSKAQKNAVFALQRYGISHNEKDFQEFESFLKIPEGDHRARTELMKVHANPEIIRAGFLQGRVHSDDIEPMVDLLRRFYWISYLAHAIEQWTKGDLMIAEIKQKAELFHAEIKAGHSEVASSILIEIKALDQKIGAVEDEFSSSLGEGSRWLEGRILTLLLFAVLIVEGVGLTLAIYTARTLSRGLKKLDLAAEKIGSGNFSEAVDSDSTDEIGNLALALNRMRLMLQESYQKLEERVALRTKELAAALSYRDEFLSIASHELKTPVTAMYLQLQLLERKMKTETGSASGIQLENSVHSLIDRSRRLKLLIEELFDLTILHSGKLELHRNEIEIVPLVQDALQSLKYDADSKGIKINFTVNAKTDQKINADPIRITQVLTNLISNAIKYGGGRPVGIILSSSDSDVTVSVKDSAEGIEASELERIFDRFERANDDPRISGLGLGLYISKLIVDAHSGTLSVTSEPGHGTCFMLKLPV